MEPKKETTTLITKRKPAALDTIQEEVLQIQHELEHLTNQFNRGWIVRLDVYGFAYGIMMIAFALLLVLAVIFLILLVISFID